jgi:predicted nuclease of predicted toxin-antitoxin system
MAKFLIDANLPYYFSLWNSEEYIHLKDLDDSWADSIVWRYAKGNNLTIVTKGSDFSNRILFHSPPPKVIHIRIGNMRMKEFFQVVEKSWDEVLELNKTYKLITMYKDRIECIS